MKKFYPIVIFLLFIMYAFSNAQVGLGAYGKLNHPGFFKSDNNIYFEPGIGYGFFVRHDLLTMELTSIDVRYTASSEKHNTKLPNNGKTEYEFSDFSVEVLVVLNKFENSILYAGFSGSLLSVIGKPRFVKNYNAESVYPGIVAGFAYNWANGFDAFCELKTIFGNTDAGPEKIPVTGISINLGFTMYISDE